MRAEMPASITVCLALQLVLMQLCQQLHALRVEVDVALQLLVDAVYLLVIHEGCYLALLQSLCEEGERLLHELHVAMTDDLLEALQLLVAGAQRRLCLVLSLRHLQLCTLTALTGCLYVGAVAVERKADAHLEAVDAFALLRVATITEGDAGKPLVLLHLQIHVGGAEGGLSHCHISVGSKGKRAILLEVSYLRIDGQLRVYHVQRLATVELAELLHEGSALALRLADEGAHLHAVEPYLVKLKSVGVACLHALLIHLEERLAVGKALTQHGEGLIEADKVDADQLSLEEDVAALLGKELVAHGLLHLSLLVACGILRGEINLLAYHKLALRHAGVSLREERAVLHGRSGEGVARLYLKHIGLAVVGKRLQGEVVGCHLLEHVANGVGKGCAIRAERHYCCD